MAKQSKEQKETVERVMHEFKHGELETAGGRKVTSQRQAVAIGLSEAGASNENSPAENKRNRARTRKNEAGSRTGKAEAEGSRTKAELYEIARKRTCPAARKCQRPNWRKRSAKRRSANLPAAPASDGRGCPASKYGSNAGRS